MESGKQRQHNKGMRIKLPRLKPQMKAVGAIFIVLCLTVGQAAIADSPPVMLDSKTSEGVFWAIEKNGQKAGYLLGTIHSEDPRVLDFSQAFLDKLNICQVYAMEMVPDLATLHQLTQYMNYQDGQTLESVIGAERFKLLKNAMSGYQIPQDFIKHMKPWAAMMTLSTPAPKTGFFMDLSLSLRASGNSIDVVGLETLEQQLSFLENMPLDMQLTLLDQAISDVDQVEAMQTEMVDAYLENSLQGLGSITDDEFEAVGPEAQAYFYENGIAKRNHRMLASLLPLLERQQVFVAVGALHLPGKDGLLALLLKNDYQLIPQAMPFPN